jgi:hypothetical protein
MKRLFLFLTLLGSVLTGFSHIERASIYSNFAVEDNLINICELTNIQIQKSHCKDILILPLIIQSQAQDIQLNFD